ncbi:uncharacterized phage protein (possible DNA packaging) [Pedobacter sp. ok626]|uniref:head-tail connector protein n=1 Tax=Pedobacter sp. ok626 TaxID=1761882 RepID=UPI00087EB791|nr:head-tail connector protein [Pedobacter sp. ok626]SDJ95882.1 uncharacterized phage protein (possible DNA packaging) [Pedobacter sp. ok626]
MLTLELTKQYLNIHPSNTTEDTLIQLLIDAAEIQAYKLISTTEGMIDNALIDLALLKDIASNYMHRENYLDSKNGGLILSNGTLSILNQYRKVIVY